jgi:hypothetical protein
MDRQIAVTQDLLKTDRGKRSRRYLFCSSASLVNSSPNMANAITGSSAVASVRKNACDSVFHVREAHHTNARPACARQPPPTP